MIKDRPSAVTNFHRNGVMIIGITFGITLGITLGYFAYVSLGSHAEEKTRSVNMMTAASPSEGVGDSPAPIEQENKARQDSADPVDNPLPVKAGNASLPTAAAPNKPAVTAKPVLDGPHPLEHTQPGWFSPVDEDSKPIKPKDSD